MLEPVDGEGLEHCLVTDLAACLEQIQMKLLMKRFACVSRGETVSVGFHALREVGPGRRYLMTFTTSYDAESRRRGVLNLRKLTKREHVVRTLFIERFRMIPDMNDAEVENVIVDAGSNLRW